MNEDFFVFRPLRLSNQFQALAARHQEKQERFMEAYGGGPKVLAGRVGPNDYYTTKKENTVNTLSRKDVLQAQIAAMQRELTQYQQFPDDADFPEYTALKFSKTYSDQPDKTYTFLAIKAGGVWFLTGQAKPVTYDQLVQKYMMESDGVEELWTKRQVKKVAGEDKVTAEDAK